MRSSLFTPLLALAASSVSAITITFPPTTNVTTTQGGTPRLDLSVPQTITWDTTTNDPATIDINLVIAPKDGSSNNQSTSTTEQGISIAKKVTTSDAKYVMAPPSGLTLNETYQIFFYGPYNATTVGVVAESNFFIAAKIGGASTTTTGSVPSKTNNIVASTTPAKSAGNVVTGFAAAGLLTAFAVLLM